MGLSISTRLRLHLLDNLICRAHDRIATPTYSAVSQALSKASLIYLATVRNDGNQSKAAARILGIWPHMLFTLELFLFGQRAAWHR